MNGVMMPAENDHSSAMPVGQQSAAISSDDAAALRQERVVVSLTHRICLYRCFAILSGLTIAMLLLICR